RGRVRGPGGQARAVCPPGPSAEVLGSQSFQISAGPADRRTRARTEVVRDARACDNLGQPMPPRMTPLGTRPLSQAAGGLGGDGCLPVRFTMGRYVPAAVRDHAAVADG